MNEDKLKNFVKTNEAPKKDDDSKVLGEKDGLLERIDIKLVTKDGKQLLKEQLYETN